ncbi:MAG: GGDEF domain-containing protein [Candidatus Pacearchaeota archaeon]|nr:GGDEF domain-containing protein [Candidatus Pacearchaeota archaeon]
MGNNIKDRKEKQKRFDTLYKISKEIKEEISKPRPEPKALERLFNELYAYATRDHLTGVFNRRVLDELLSKEMERAIRHKLPLAVIMLDIDNFKQYNDKFGHLQGDMALKTVTDTIQKITRPEDFVARYGGEEFILVLPDTTIEKAKGIAERIRKEISETRIRPATKSIEKTERGYEKVTVSIGIAQLKKDGVQGMLERADEALYKAKERGKNQVCIID